MAKKPSFGPILAHLAQIWGAKFFFLKDLAASFFRYHSQLSSCTISEKNNDSILRKLSDGQTNRRAGEQKDESDFIERRPINVKRPATRKS